MSRSYLKLGLSPSISNLAVLRIAIRRLHPDTLAVRSFREARKRYYRELLDAHAVARAAAGIVVEPEPGEGGPTGLEVGGVLPLPVTE